MAMSDQNSAQVADRVIPRHVKNLSAVLQRLQDHNEFMQRQVDRIECPPPSAPQTQPSNLTPGPAPGVENELNFIIQMIQNQIDIAEGLRERLSQFV